MENVAVIELPLEWWELFCAAEGAIAGFGSEVMAAKDLAEARRRVAEAKYLAAAAAAAATPGGWQLLGG